MFVYELSFSGLASCCSDLTSDLTSASSKEFLDIEVTMERAFALKSVREMTRRYSQMHCRDKYPKDSSIIRPLWPNGLMFVDKLSGSGFESSCSHLNFRFCASLQQEVS